MTNARQAKTAREKAAELRAQAARQEARRRATAIIGAVAAVLVVIVGAGVLILTAQHNQQVKQDKTSAVPAHLVDGSMLVGKSTAKVTIKLYEDFQCPVCKEFEAADAPLLAGWVADGTAKIEYHPVAILDRMSSTNYSTRALNAAAAVFNIDPQLFVKYHSLLYANQPAENSVGLPDSKLIDLAVQAGVQRSAVESAITAQTYKGWTAQVTDNFSQIGLTGTPTVIINGKQLDDWSPDKLKAAVQAAAKA